jgi:type II secretory pathway component PulF
MNNFLEKSKEILAHLKAVSLTEALDTYFPTAKMLASHAQTLLLAQIPVPAGINFRTVSDMKVSVPRMFANSKKEVMAKLPKPKKSKMRKPFMLRFSTQDQILFAKRLSMILRSGMPIMEGLHMLRDETTGGSALYIYESLVVDVSHGQPLSTGLGKFERIFGEFVVNIIKVGETSGTLHENLGYLSDELKRKQALKRKVVGALVYPALIVTATVGITLMLTVFIFPKIVPIFTSVKATLPASTRALIAISSFLGAWGLWCFLGLVAAVIAYFFALRTSYYFHRFIDGVLLRLPLFGKLSKYYNLANICRTMSILLKSDVRIVEAMELVANATRNLAYREELIRAREEIAKGQKISLQFKSHPRLFPTLMTQMITVGESTGNLGGTFSFLSEMYEEDIGELTKNLTTLLEPILMIVMGAVVGFIAISIITPIYSITTALQPH